MKVVDALALAALVVEERGAYRLTGGRLIAPALLRFEMTNVCRTKCRRHPEDRDSLAQRLALGLAFGIEEAAVDHAAVLELSLETKLTAYDASYLWSFPRRHPGRRLGDETGSQLSICTCSFPPNEAFVSQRLGRYVANRIQP